MKKTRWIALAAALGLLACLLTGCAGEKHDARTGVARVLAQYEVKEGLPLHIGGETVMLFEGWTRAKTGSSFGVGEAWEPTDIFVTNRHVVANHTVTMDIQEILNIAGANFTWEDLGLPSRYYDVEYVLTDVCILLDDYACKSHADGTLTIDTSRTVPCQVLYQSPSVGPDIAILQAANDVPGRVALPLAQAEDGVKVGDSVTAIGFPGDSDITALDEYEDMNIYASVDSSTLTKGVVSRFTTMVSEKNTKIIQHGAQINNGNSGGPLVNDKDQVVGINTWGWGDNSQGAIYVDYALDELENLHIDLDPGPDVKLIVIAVAGVAVAAAVVVAVVLVLRKKGGKKGGKKAAVLVLVGTAGVLAGSRFPLSSTQLMAGRDLSQCTVLYPKDHPGVSFHHCCVWAENGVAYIRDVGSTFGTYVNGSRLAPGENRPLAPGAVISLGSPDESFTLMQEGGV